MLIELIKDGNTILLNTKSIVSAEIIEWTTGLIQETKHRKLNVICRNKILLQWDRPAEIKNVWSILKSLSCSLKPLRSEYYLEDDVFKEVSLPKLTEEKLIQAATLSVPGSSVVEVKITENSFKQIKKYIPKKIRHLISLNNCYIRKRKVENIAKN